MAPQLEFVDQIIRMISWPTLLAVLVWVIRKWDAGQRDFKELRDNTTLAVVKVSTVESEVLAIKNNHLAHLQEGITQVAKSNDQAVAVLQNIDTNIKILSDRFPRA